MPRLSSALRLLLVVCLGLSGAARAVAEPGSSVLVKLRSEGPHAVRDCAEARSRRGEHLASATADGSDSLDRLQRELGVRSVRAVFRRPDGEPFARQRARLSGRLRAAYAKRRGPRAAAPELPDLAHVYRLELPPGGDARRAAARLRADPHIAYAQPNYAVDVDLLLDDPFLQSQGTWGQPYPDQWGPLTIDAPAAWDVTLGEGVLVAVVDTGVDREHPDIVANLWVNPGEDLDGNGVIDPSDLNGLDDDGNGFVDDLQGYDFHDDDADPQDENGHGSHVSGIATARGGNGIGIAGVAPRATLMPVRTFPPFGSGETDRVWRGVLYAAMNGADVINASFSCGTVCRSNPIAEEVMAVVSELGVTFVTSAGNAASDVMLKSPERLRESIVVGSLQPSGALAASSSFGFLVDVVAPGQDVLSLRASAAPQFYSPFGFVGDAYLRLSGTSMAAPHVTGTVALLLSEDPTLTPEEVRARLRGSAVDIGPPGHDRRFGAGRVQPAAALEAAAVGASGEILSPLPGDTLDTDADSIPIIGRVEGANVDDYVLEIGEGADPQGWTPLAGTPAPPFAAREIARLPLAELADGAYVLRLTLATRDGRELREFTPLSVDRNRPVFVSSEDQEALNPDVHGLEVVWESSREREDGEEDSDLFAGLFGHEGEWQLVGGPGDQVQPAVSGRGVVWLDRRRPGFGFNQAAVQVCRRRGLRGSCLPRDATEGAALRTRPAASGPWVAFAERAEGRFELQACRLSAWGCFPRRVAEESVSPQAPFLDGSRMLWSDQGAGGLFTCELGSREGCAGTPLDVAANLPVAAGLSGSLVTYFDLSFVDFQTKLYVCELEPESGGCTGTEIASFPGSVPSTADVSRGRVVWHADGPQGKPDIYFCEYDAQARRCPVQRITSDPTDQTRPRIDGLRVVWEDERNGVRRVASFVLPALAPIGDRSVRSGAPVLIPLRSVGSRAPVRFSASTAEGEEIGRVFQTGPTRAWLWWRPRADELGQHTLRIRATRTSGIYTEERVTVEVRER